MSSIFENATKSAETPSPWDSDPEPSTLDVGKYKWPTPTRIPTFEEMKAQLEESRRFLARERQELAAKYG
jgi:hypothetical protein